MQDLCLEVGDCDKKIIRTEGSTSFSIKSFISVWKNFIADQ